MYQANAIFNALEEGIINYLVWEAEQQGKKGGDIREQVHNKLITYGWTQETIDYWLEEWLKF